jgi:hypothetical protein
MLGWETRRGEVVRPRISWFDFVPRQRRIWPLLSDLRAPDVGMASLDSPRRRQRRKRRKLGPLSKRWPVPVRATARSASSNLSPSPVQDAISGEPQGTSGEREGARQLWEGHCRAPRTRLRSWGSCGPLGPWRALGGTSLGSCFVLMLELISPHDRARTETHSRHA